MRRSRMIVVGVVVFDPVIEHLYQKNMKTGLSDQGKCFVQIVWQLLSFKKVKGQNDQDNEIADGIDTGVAPEII